jgi:ATP-dependent protease Clp ATPase subunit
MTDLKVSEGRCQFCHRQASDVPRLISGDSAFICSDCVESCSALLRPSDGEAKPDEPAEHYLFQRLARHFAPLRPQELSRPWWS